MNTKSIKGALISSIVSLILCFAMLLGTTYAWFTDTAASCDNKIVAGTLDIQLFQWTAPGVKKDISESGDPVFSAATVWEPGCTEVVYLSIRNNGNLALRYRVLLDVTELSLQSLTDVMEYAITPNATYGGVPAWAGNGTRVSDGTNETQAVNVTLLPGEEHFFGLSVHMVEGAGDEYMGEHIVFDIKVLATQLPHEQDSFDDRYDEDSTYPNLSHCYRIPAVASEPAILGTEQLKVSLSADLLNALPSEVLGISLTHSEGRVDTAENTVTFDAVDLVDQGGTVLDLAALGNTQGIQVTLPVSGVFAPGTVVRVFHDGACVAETAVDASGNITYETTHFCTVTVTERVCATAHFLDGHTVDFHTLGEAMRYRENGVPPERIVIHEDVTEPMDILEGNLVCGKEGGVTITNTIRDAWIYCGSANFTVGEGVTYRSVGYESGLFLYGYNCVINGTVIVDYYYQRYGGSRLTINSPGSLTVLGDPCILRYTDGAESTGIFVNGDNDDSTVELDIGVLYFYQGFLVARDATLRFGTYWQTNETDGSGSANLILDHTTMTVTVNEHPLRATGNSFVTLQNGSTLVAAGGIVADHPFTLDKASAVSPAE